MDSTLEITKPIERELKYKLSRRDYKTIIEHLESQGYDVTPKKFVNDYYDTPRLDLHERRFRLRIRSHKGSPSIMTVKSPAKTETKRLGLKVRHESEEPIRRDLAATFRLDASQMMELPAGPIEFLKGAFPREMFSRLQRIGTIRTWRTTVALNQSFKFEIDRFQVCGKSFHEMECEVPGNLVDEASRFIEKFFENVGVESRPTKKSKARRLIEMTSALS